MTQSAVERLGEIFPANAPMTDPGELYGRSAELRDIMVAYGSSTNGVPVVSGSPGIGKTSLLNMLRQVLLGYEDILEPRGLGAYGPRRATRIVIIQPCDSLMVDEDALSTTLLKNISRALAERPDAKSFRLRTFDIEASLPFASVKASWERHVESVQTVSPTELLSLQLGRITDESLADEVCVLLDECERLPWLERLLDYTRRFYLDETRFAIAVRDHLAHRMANEGAGDYRWPNHVPVSPLTPDRIAELFQSASTRLRDFNIHWTLSPDALKYIVNHSGGEPWYLQMIGEALLFNSASDFATAVASGVVVSAFVSDVDVREAERVVLKRHLLGLHSQRYDDLCRHSTRREEVLRALAKFPGAIIPDAFVRDYRIKRTRDYVRGMAGGSDPVLLRVPHSNAWQFAQHQFRVFCRLTTPFVEANDTFAEIEVEKWQLH